METVPGIAHDHAELRRRAYLSAAAASNDDPNGVEVVIKAYLRNRSEAAFRHLYADTLPFLAEIRKRGALIAAISDGNGDVTLSETLNGLFDFSVSAVSAGADKAHVAQFLQVLTQGRQRLGPGLVAQDIIVVGDNFSKDVIGSVKSGVRAAWLCREGATPRGEITGGEEAFCREHDVVIIDGLHVDAIFTPRTQVPTIPPSM
jgi:FMN phosphatase YigB (HAD superfamily)